MENHKLYGFLKQLAFRPPPPPPLEKVGPPLPHGKCLTPSETLEKNSFLWNNQTKKQIKKTKKKKLFVACLDTPWVKSGPNPGVPIFVSLILFQGICFWVISRTSPGLPYIVLASSRLYFPRRQAITNDDQQKQFQFKHGTLVEFANRISRSAPSDQDVGCLLLVI